MAVTVMVQNATGVPLPKAKIFFTWSDDRSGDCTTDDDGLCMISSKENKQSKMPSMTFTITDITHDDSMLWQYNPTLNTDPDGDDSNGTSITLSAQ